MSPAEPPISAQVEGAPRTLRPWPLALAALGLAALWLLDSWLWKRPVLTRFQGQPPLSPLYAFWQPVLRPQLLVFVLGALLWVVQAPRLCDPERCPRPTFLLA